MAAVDVRRLNRQHVVTARILCNSLKVTPGERIKVSRCTNVSHLLQGESDTEDFSLWRGLKVESGLIGSVVVPS